MIGRPQSAEAATYYFSYIDQVPGDDVLRVIESQLDEYLGLFSGISEEKSLHRYAPDKWSIRQVLSHLSDTERLFVFRAFWFARGFDTPLPSFDQHIGVAGAEADKISWAAHVEEFRRVRLATIPFFKNLPPHAWTRSGIASGNPFSVRALAYMVAGHTTHHVIILRDRYL
jgi:DinB family protein